MTPRLAAVSFLNTVPLVEWFFRPESPAVEVKLALPSELAGYLAAGRADVGLLPVAEVLAGKSAGILSDVCIASTGAVDSVKVFVSGELDSVVRISADRGSRSSIAMLRILLAERLGSTPPVVEAKPVPGTVPQPGEGVLVIGDRCFEYEKQLPMSGEVKAFDLGNLWYELPKLPIVFAVWAAAPDYVQKVGPQELQRVANLLNQARDFGLSILPELAAREALAGRMGINGEATAQAIDYYFRHSLHYKLGDPEMAGIQRFHELSTKHGILPAGPMPSVL